MSQHDYNVANGGGAAVRGDINNALQAMLTSNSGTSAPSVTAPFMLWYDTANGVLKQRNAADSAWDVFAPGRLLNVQTFTATGTYTPTAGTRFVIVEAVGGGGGSGANRATAAGQSAVSQSGGAGTYGRGLFTSGFSGVTVTIGDAGAGGIFSTNPFDGSNGGTTSFGGLMSCPGGLGGLFGEASSTHPKASLRNTPANAATGANLGSRSGEPGHPSLMLSATLAFDPGFMTGPGGSSPFGQGGLAAAGSGYGAGGGGRVSPQSTAGVAGYSGTAGVVYVYEYS